MYNKPAECANCVLEKKGYSFIKPEGLGLNNVVVVGEGPGDAEARDGLPFRPKAQSGAKLEECFQLAAGELLEPINRQMFKIWNLIACQPPANLLADMPWEHGAVMHCRKAYFNDAVNDVADVSKRVILALGNVPLKYLTSASGIAKEKQSITHLRGYVFKSPEYGLIVPSLHPSYIQRGKPNLTSLLKADIILALKTARGEFVHRWHKDYVKPRYIENPCLEDCFTFYQQVVDNPNKILTYDIETDTDVEEDEKGQIVDDIRQVQFSLEKGTGIAISWSYPYIEVIKKIFATSNTKANHNTWNFDNPKISLSGVDIKGNIHDTMWMFKHYQPNLPRGLQAVVSLAGFPFPWKHLFGSRLQYYGCADVDAVQWILEWLPPIMKAMNVWRGYYDHVFSLYSPTLLRAKNIGIPVSETERLKLYDEKTQTGIFEDKRIALDNELQELVPNEIKNIKPKVKDKKTGVIRYGYINPPRDIKKLEASYNYTVKIRKEEGRPVITPFEEVVKARLGYELRSFDGDIERWCRVEPFKASLDQVAKYIRWQKARLENSLDEEDKYLAEYYEVPVVPRVDKKTGERSDKESTGVKVLTELFEVTGDRVLEAALELRSVGTIINNFIPNWKPADDGAVHTTWGFSAASGQLDSRKPNVLNCSKHTDNGQRFRRTIEAPEGYTFVEFDKRSYHVATMGFEANSKQYIRFSQLDPHSIFASWIMPNDWGTPIDMNSSDEEILEQCAYIKKRSGTPGELPVRQIAKPCVLGNQLGLGYMKLWAQNKKLIESPKKAKELQARLAERFSEVEAAKARIKEAAHNQKFLINDWGYIQWFYEIFKWHYSKRFARWVRGNGTDAEKALAFAVQGDAFGEIKWNLLEAERLGYNEKWNFINSIHDSVIYMPRVSDLEQCIVAIYNLFSRPCGVLVNQATGIKGLQVGVEISVGRNWQKQDYFGKGTNSEGMREVKGKEMREVYGLA